MKRAISRMLLKLAGWKAASVEGVEMPKCVICVAPHTSNWDFFIGKAEVKQALKVGVVLTIPAGYTGTIAIAWQSPAWWRGCELLSLVCTAGCLILALVRRRKAR